MKELTFKSEDETKIHALRWDIENPKAVVQIIHGLAEHIERYDEFAVYLNSLGFAVAGEDHRGHGKTAESVEKAGYFADRDGWNKVVRDNLKLGEMLREDYPGIPFYIFGHSMGSFLSRKLIAEYPENVDKVVLSGSGDFADSQLAMLSFIAKLQAFFIGKKAAAKLIDKLSFSSMNDQFNPGRTGFEWLSRDDKKVDEYINDPFCGFVAKLGLYIDFAEGIKYLKSGECFEKTRKDLPILFYSGEKDPVGGNGELIKKVAKQYADSGFTNVELILNPEGRHESLNERNRKDVYKEIVEWFLK